MKTTKIKNSIISSLLILSCLFTTIFTPIQVEATANRKLNGNSGSAVEGYNGASGARPEPDSLTYAGSTERQGLVFYVVDNETQQLIRTLKPIVIMNDVGDKFIDFDSVVTKFGTLGIGDQLEKIKRKRGNWYDDLEAPIIWEDGHWKGNGVKVGEWLLADSPNADDVSEIGTRLRNWERMMLDSDVPGAEELIEDLKTLRLEQWEVTKDQAKNQSTTPLDGSKVSAGASFNGGTLSTEDKYYLRDDAAGKSNSSVIDVSPDIATNKKYYTVYATTSGEIKGRKGTDCTTGDTLSQDKLDELDKRTGVVTALKNALEQKSGSDTTATWGGTEGKWYSEAFDGITVVVETSTFTLGLVNPNERSSVLDPKLTAPSSGKADLKSKGLLCIVDSADGGVCLVEAMNNMKEIDATATVNINDKTIPEGYVAIDPQREEVQLTSTELPWKYLDFNKVHVEVNIYGEIGIN